VITVTIVDDTEYEGDESFSISLSNPTGGASLGSPAVATVTISDNELPPPAGELALQSGSYSVSEAGATISLNVVRGNGDAGAVSVDFSTTDGSATAGSDYQASSGTLSFADGELSKTVQVTILDDAVFEGDELFYVQLSNPQGGATLGNPASAAVTIIEDEATPPAGILRLASASYSVPENGNELVLQVERVSGDFGAVTVEYGSIDGTAIAGSDYTAVSGVLSFADGEVVKSISLPILDDAVYEGDETLELQLQNATNGATVGTPALATITIVENEAPPPPGALQFAGADYSVNEDGGLVTLTVSRSGGSQGVVAIDFSTSDQSATGGDDYVALSGTLTFADGEVSQSFSVTINDDTTYEGNEMFVVDLAVNIVEDDAPPSAGNLTLSGATYSASESAGSVQITVTRTGGSNGAVNVSYATRDRTAIAGSDYESASGTLTFQDGELSRSIAIVLIDDSEAEGNEVFDIELSAASNGAGLNSPSEAAITITDNDRSAPATGGGGGGGGGAISPLMLLIVLLLMSISAAARNNCIMRGRNRIGS